MSIIMLNLVDNQLAYIRNYNGPAEVWKTLCNIYKTRRMLNMIFVCCKFFTYKMQKNNNLLDHINKVKALTDHLACLEVPVTNGRCSDDFA